MSGFAVVEICRTAAVVALILTNHPVWAGVVVLWALWAHLAEITAASKQMEHIKNLVEGNAKSQRTLPVIFDKVAN